MSLGLKDGFLKGLGAWAMRDGLGLRIWGLRLGPRGLASAGL